MTTSLTTLESLVAVVEPNPQVRTTALWTVAAVSSLAVPTQLGVSLMSLLAVVQVPPQIGFTPRPFFMMME